MSNLHSHCGSLVPDGGHSEHKLLGAVAVTWLGEVKQYRVQETVHAGKRPGALIDDGEHVPHLAGGAGQSAHH